MELTKYSIWGIIITKYPIRGTETEEGINNEQKNNEKNEGRGI